MTPIQPPPPPSYQCIIAENAYLKHAMAYQNQLVEYHSSNAASLYHDAMRWRRFKSLLNEKHGNDAMANSLEKHVDDVLNHIDSKTDLPDKQLKIITKRNSDDK